jgi:hypothetical protein
MRFAQVNIAILRYWNISMCQTEMGFNIKTTRTNSSPFQKTPYFHRTSHTADHHSFQKQLRQFPTFTFDIFKLSLNDEIPKFTHPTLHA